MTLTSSGEASQVVAAPAAVNSSRVARVNFAFDVVFRRGTNGKYSSIHELGWTRYLSNISVLQRADGANRLILQFHNPENNSDFKYIFSDSSLLSEGTQVKVQLGWAETSVVNHGTFYIHAPSQRYGSTDAVTINAFGEEYLLAREGEKQRGFKLRQGQITDSDVVRIIAQEHSLSHSSDSVAETTGKYNLIVQAGETDWDFLSKRARLNGFQLYIEDGVIFFRRPKTESTGGSLILRSGNSVLEDNILSLTARVSTFRTAPVVKKSQVDAYTWEILEKESRDEQRDALARRYPAALGVIHAPDIVDRGKRATMFLIGEGHLNNASEIQRQVDEMFRSSGFGVVELECRSIGLEFMRHSRTVALSVGGADRLRGEYMIREVEHVFDTSRTDTYESRFVLARSFLFDEAEDISTGSVTAPGNVRAPVFTDADDANLKPLRSDMLASSGVTGVVG